MLNSEYISRPTTPLVRHVPQQSESLSDMSDRNKILISWLIIAAAPVRKVHYNTASAVRLLLRSGLPLRPLQISMGGPWNHSQAGSSVRLSSLQRPVPVGEAQADTKVPRRPEIGSIFIPR
jgi:hypothetical protein